MERRNKDLEEKKAIAQRLRLLKAVSRSSTAPIQQQLSTVSISSQTPATNPPIIGNPFANTGGGQGNLKFTTNSQPTCQARNPPSGPRPAATPEQKAELRALLSKFSQHHDNTGRTPSPPSPTGRLGEDLWIRHQSHRKDPLPPLTWNSSRQFRRMFHLWSAWPCGCPLRHGLQSTVSELSIPMNSCRE